MHEETAALAAARAGVRIDTVNDQHALHDVENLLARIWQMPSGQGPVPVDVLRSIAHAGGAVHVAYAGQEPVGASVAFFSAPEDKAVYSLVAAARSSDRGVGFALKQAQRVWALRRGATTMRWTFDPLVGRNARFNLMKLGAVAREYTVDFYGAMDDGVQGSDETDRLTAEWTLDIDKLPSEVDAPAEASRLAQEAPDGGPLVAKDERGLWCRVPADIVALRRSDPGEASRWRLALREVFVPAFAEGHVATGMTRDGWYRLERQ
ncbi:MAG TPA: chorismate synthase [Micromonosporaceae bacterium]|nr:chorismate synthase [Micromonosporaceae bacterium]HCU49052.1 chorismate synthase [Micromonosporaceae bacterium]